MFATMRVIAKAELPFWRPGPQKCGEIRDFAAGERMARGVQILGREYALDEWNIMSPNLSNVRDKTIRSSYEAAKWGTIL